MIYLVILQLSSSPFTVMHRKDNTVDCCLCALIIRLFAVIEDGKGAGVVEGGKKTSQFALSGAEV